MTKEYEQNYYICGQCKSKIFYLKTEEPPSKCPDCGWCHKERDPRDVPAEVKISLNKY